MKINYRSTRKHKFTHKKQRKTRKKEKRKEKNPHTHKQEQRELCNTVDMTTRNYYTRRED